MNTIDWNKIKTSFEDIKLEDKMLIIPMVYADAFYFKLKSEAMKNAIPVEWIEMFMEKYRLNGDNEYKVLHFMMTEWKRWVKENGTN